MALNIKDIEKSLTSDEIVSLIIPDEEYDTMLIKIAGSLSKDYKKILYVSIDKPCKLLVSNFKQNKIDPNKFYFIDCITKNEKEVSSIENCTHVSSPMALDEIKEVIFHALEKQKIDVTLIDSISSLSIYNEHANVLKFMHSVDCKLIAKKSKGVFPFRKGKEKENIDKRESIEMFTDNTWHLDIKKIEDFFR